MSLSQKLVQKQGQTVSFTTQLRQAIELLELSHLDLQAHVQQQIMDNPFLEIESAETSTETQASEDPQSLTSDQQEKEVLYEEMGSENYDNVWTSADARLTSRSNRDEEDSFGRFESLATQELTLRDHVLSQINTDFEGEKDRLIAAALLESLDETGYFVAPLPDISFALGADLEDVKAVLERLKGCDPAGIFAGSLRECLALQLMDQGLYDDKTKVILEYIDLFADARIQDLLNKAKCTTEELKNCIERLKRLDPKPGLRFYRPVIQTLVPDVYVHRDKESGAWMVRLNAETLPKVLISQDYKVRAGLDLKKDKDLRKYYQERMGEANWLVRALDQRAQNILKVVEEIILQQAGFFEKGVSALRPLVLRQVADAIGVHESTVSRITQNKYLSCHRGTFELRYFFSASITNAWTGEDQSALQIQHKIQELIRLENPLKPLSDDALVLKLSEHNLDVARRTIAKYRELLKIPSSYERKKRYRREL